MSGERAGQARLSPIYARIAGHYRDLISSGELRAGDRLPPVRHLASAWGVARQTADRALSALRDEGLVRTAGRSGTVVLGDGDGPNDLAVVVALGRRPPLNVTSANVIVARGKTARDLLVEPGTSVLVVQLDEDESGS